MSNARDRVALLIHDAQFGHTREDPMTWPAHIYKAANAILSHMNTLFTDTDRRDRAQDAVLEFNGTPRRELFEYPYRADESRELITGADRVVVHVLDAMLGEPEA